MANSQHAPARNNSRRRNHTPKSKSPNSNPTSARTPAPTSGERNGSAPTSGERSGSGRNNRSNKGSSAPTSGERNNSTRNNGSGNGNGSSSGASTRGGRRGGGRSSHGRGNGGRNNGGRNNSGRGNATKKSKLIDPALFVNEDVKPAPQAEYTAEHSFDDFNFDERIARNIRNRGYESPTRIQDTAIKPILERRDVIGLANTGTGKTAAFILPVIEHLLKTEGKNDVLIITPTRELAAQINDDFRAFTKNIKLFSALCVGGTNINPQIRALADEPHVVIGTPGRLKDLVEQGKLDLSFTDTLILDEADRMLDMGFVRDVTWLCDRVPTERQTLCFSATMTKDIERLIDELLNDPVTCSVRVSMTNDHIHQSVVHATSKQEKLETLHELLIDPDLSKAIVFTRTKWGAQRLSDQLSKRGFKSAAIHGNKSQPQRMKALKAFKSDQINVLVATDVAARGLDIPAVSHVINFDEPQTHDDYIHRIGRTGRAGQGGSAVTFVAER